jgi:hypothetical protein
VSLPWPLSLEHGLRSISQLIVVNMLCWFSDCFSILQHHLTLYIAYQLRRWALWMAIFPISGSRLSPTHCRPVYLSSLCLLQVSSEISSLLLSPSPVCLESTLPPLLHVPFQILVYYSVCFFVKVGGQSVQGAILVYPRSGCGNTAQLTCWSSGCLPRGL